MESTAEVIGGGRIGWERVAHGMDRQLDRGLTTARHWQDYLEGKHYQVYDPRMRPMKAPDGSLIVHQDAGYLDSWAHFERWKREHPDATVPGSVRRIRTNGQHAAWAAAGFPDLEAREEFLGVHGAVCPKRCGTEFGREAEPTQGATP